jgi:hypothetical protein
MHSWRLLARGSGQRPAPMRTLTSVGAGFVTKVNPTGSALVYSTYLNGAAAHAVAVDAAGNAYVTGSALSTVVPTTRAPSRPPSRFGGVCQQTEHDGHGPGLLHLYWWHLRRRTGHRGRRGRQRLRDGGLRPTDGLSDHPGRLPARD